MFIPSRILGFKGQCMNGVEVDNNTNKLTINCHRDKHFNALDPNTGKKGKVNILVKKAVREILPQADIVFDRFHVMQNDSKVIKNQRRSEFRKASEDNKEWIKE